MNKLQTSTTSPFIGEGTLYADLAGTSPGVCAPRRRSYAKLTIHAWPCIGA